MTKSKIMKRLVALFQTTHENEDKDGYPPALLSRYEVTKTTLGVGSFAVVKECVRRSTKEHFALKIIMKKVIAGKEHMLDSELGKQHILKHVQHEHVVSMYDLYESKDAIYIVTRLATGGELFQQLLDKGSYTERDAARLVKQILEGLLYLHGLDIVHRDIKPENLLFATKSPDAPLLITDFGLSKIMKNHDDVLMTACGTPGYVAPEVLLQKGHGKPVDIWSVGVITFVMLCGYTPFYGEDQAALFESIMSGKYEFDEEYWSDISKNAKSFIDGLLMFNPEKRLTAKQALEHPWITGEDKPSEPTNLVSVVKRAVDNHSHLKSMVTAMTLLNHWRHLDGVPDVSDSESSTEVESATQQVKKLDIHDK
ncbi:kinase-like domain-containing protein [Gongronella butleri]|nr:kinase-like domain-containing protein [Gongronella butleri]